MVTSISSASPAAAFRTTAGGASPALQDKLSRCQQQLGDWQACPSRKTPEGKKIIQDLQTQIRNLESRIGSTGSSGGVQPATPSVAASQGSDSMRNTGADAGLLGRFVNVFA